MNYLHAAYAATWIIHIVYVGILVGQYSRVRRDIQEMQNKGR